MKGETHNYVEHYPRYMINLYVYMNVYYETSLLNTDETKYRTRLARYSSELEVSKFVCVSSSIAHVSYLHGRALVGEVSELHDV